MSILVRKPGCLYIVDCVLFEDGFSLNGTIVKRYPNRNVFELAHQLVRCSKIYCFEYLHNVFFSAFRFPFPFHREKASLKHTQCINIQGIRYGVLPVFIFCLVFTFSTWFSCTYFLLFEVEKRHFYGSFMVFTFISCPCH